MGKGHVSLYVLPCTVLGSSFTTVGGLGNKSNSFCPVNGVDGGLEESLPVQIFGAKCLGLGAWCKLLGSLAS